MLLLNEHEQFPQLRSPTSLIWLMTRAKGTTPLNAIQRPFHLLPLPLLAE